MLKRTARYCRENIAAPAREALDAEDKQGEPRRYAAYSVWARHWRYSQQEYDAGASEQRPLMRPVKRDPFAVAIWRTTDKSALQPIEY